MSTLSVPPTKPFLVETPTTSTSDLTTSLQEPEHPHHPSSNASTSRHNAAHAKEGDDGLASRLRHATGLAHQEVMQPKIAGKLVTGQLSPTLHLEYLMILYRIYSSLERALSLHSSHPALAPTYDPALLSRADSLKADCAYFTGDPHFETSGSSTVWEKVVGEIQGPGERYRKRLEELGDQSEMAHLLLAHAYVRYLGDLSGGQQIARTLRKSYSLPDSGEGSSFYDFLILPSSPFFPASSSSTTSTTTTTVTGAISAGPSETKAIKNWFRSGLDLAGERLTEKERLEVIKEAREAFVYNIRVFENFEQSGSSGEDVGIGKSVVRSNGGVKVEDGGHHLVQPNSPFTLLAVALAFVLASFIGLRQYWELDGKVWV